MAIYALEMFGILYGVLSTVVAVFLPKLIYVLDDPDNTQKVGTEASKRESGGGSKISETGNAGIYELSKMVSKMIIWLFIPVMIFGYWSDHAEITRLKALVESLQQRNTELENAAKRNNTLPAGVSSQSDVLLVRVAQSHH